ncbi:hypothetical protein [Comamonas sp.]|uniref:hypothetical protein n=1 Tax=Comamonas sp. TaxID=34028 RepID=UPI0028B1E3D3|nr:hypothetical protein [Comamonas sp.]
MLNEIQLAIASITGAKTIAEGLIAERDASKVAAATADLLTRLIEAQGAVLALQSQQLLLNTQLEAALKEKLELAGQLSAAVGKRQELSDYETVKLAHGAIVVLGQKPARDGSRQPPYLCAACAEDGKKSALSFQTPTTKSPGRKLVCPVKATHTLVLPRGGWTMDNLARSELRDGD